MSSSPEEQTPPSHRPLTEEDELLMEQILPSHKPLTEEDELLMEQILPSHTPLTDEDEPLMEQNLPSPRPNVEETEQQVVACSEPNVTPEIVTEKLKPLVLSFFERASISDLTQSETREALAEMCLEVMETLSNLILDAFRTMVLEGRPREEPLIMSEEAVTRAVGSSLWDSFKAALGSTNKSMNAFFKLIREEVTSRVNFVLHYSRTKGKRLVFPKDATYTVPKERIKAMVLLARAMLLSFQNNARLGRMSCMPIKKHYAPAVYQEEEEPEPVEEEEQRAPSRKGKRLRKTLGRCIPCGGRSVQSFSDEAGSDEEQPRARPPRARLCRVNCWPRDSSRSPDSSRTSCASFRAIIEKVKTILLSEAMELSGEDETYLRDDSVQTASDIVKSITDNMSQSESESGESLTIVKQSHKISKRCWTGVSKKINAFFTLCYVKANLRSLLSRLCCSSDVSYVPLEEVMEEASPLLEDLVQEELDQGEHMQLRKQLTDILTRMAPAQSQARFRKRVRMEVRNFMDLIYNWLHMQTQLPDLINPVQRALERIRILVFSMFCPGQARPSAQLTSTEPVPHPPQHMGPSEVPLYLQPSHAPQAQKAEGRVRTVDVPRDTSEGQDHLAWQWTKKDCNVLVYEVASRILQKNWDIMLPLSQVLMAELCEKVPQWNVLVKPSVRSCEEVASAVYKELCKGQEKSHVMHAALVQDDFSSEVLDIIHRNLTAPPKKRRTLGSFLRSVCSAICRC